MKTWSNVHKGPFTGPGGVPRMVARKNETARKSLLVQRLEAKGINVCSQGTKHQNEGF